MSHRTCLLLCAWMVGCSEAATHHDPADADSGMIDAAISGDAIDAHGNAAQRFWTPGAVEPCDIHSGYPGDELCIKPPPAELGFQLHYGPSNYDDEAEVAKYVLMPGDEVTDCVFGVTPNDTEVFHAEYHGRMRPGSHHLLVYTETPSATMTTSTGPEACNQGIGSRNIFGAQTSKIDLVTASSGAPEDQGLAQRLPAKQRSVFQLHFINTSDKPILREGWTNVIYMDKSKVKHEADPIFFLGGLGYNVAPGATVVSKGKAVAMTNLRLIEATGHYHAHTVRFSAWKTIGGVREPLFQDFDWHEPTMFLFNSVTMNTPMNTKSRAKGAYSGLVELAPGDMIDWECEVENTSSETLKFGNEVYGAEMCNMFGAYTPGIGQPWRAQNF